MANTCHQRAVPTKLALALSLAFAGMGVASAAVYTPTKITGGESWSEPGIVTVTNGVATYRFKDGDLVKPGSASSGAVHLSTSHPNTSQLNKVVMENLHLEVTDPTHYVNGLRIGTNAQSLELKNSRVDLTGYGIDGLFLQVSGAKAHLDNVTLNLDAQSGGYGVVTHYQSAGSVLSASDLTVNVTGKETALGLSIQGADHDVSAQHLSVNTTVNGGGGQYHEAWSTAINANGASKIVSQSATINATSHTHSGLNSWVEGIRAFNGADVQLGTTSINTTADIDTGKQSLIVGARAWGSQIHMADADIQVNTHLTHHSAATAANNQTFGLYAEGNASITGGNGHILAQATGSTHARDYLFVSGIEVLNQSSNNHVVWGNGSITARADLNAAGYGQVYAVNSAGDATTSVSLGNTNIAASATSAKSTSDSGFSYITGLKNAQGQLSMVKGSISAQLNGHVAKNGSAYVRGIHNDSGTVTLGEGDVFADISGTTDAHEKIFVSGVYQLNGTLTHGNGNILSQSTSTPTGTGTVTVNAISTRGALSWGDGTIQANAKVYTDTSTSTVVGLHRSSQAVGEVTLGKTDILAQMNIIDDASNAATHGSMSVTGIQAYNGMISKGQGNIYVEATGRLGQGDYLSANGAMIKDGQLDLASNNIFVKANLEANHGDQVDVRGLWAGGNAGISMADGLIQTEVNFNANARTTVNSVLGTATDANAINLGNVTIQTVAHAQDGVATEHKGMDLAGVNMREGNFTMAGGTIISRIDGVTQHGNAFGVEGSGHAHLTLGTGQGQVNITASTTSTQSGNAIGIYAHGDSTMTYNGGQIVSNEIGVQLADRAHVTIQGDTRIHGDRVGLVVNPDSTLDVLSGKVLVSTARNNGRVNVKNASLTVGGFDQNNLGHWNVADHGALALISTAGLVSFDHITVDSSSSLLLGYARPAQAAFGAAEPIAQYTIESLSNSGSVTLDHAILNTGNGLETTQDSAWSVGAGSTLNFKAKASSSSLGSVNTQFGATVNFEADSRLTGASGNGQLNIQDNVTLTLDGNSTMAAGQNRGSICVTDGAKLTTQAGYDASKGHYHAQKGELAFEATQAGIKIGSLLIDQEGLASITGTEHVADAPTLPLAELGNVTVDSIINNGTVNLTKTTLQTSEQGPGFGSLSGTWNLSQAQVSFKATQESLSIEKITADANSRVDIDNQKGKDITVNELNGDGLTVSVSNVFGPSVNVVTNNATNVQVSAQAGNGDQFESEEAFARAIAQSVTTGSGEQKQSIASKVHAAEGDIYGGFSANVGNDGTIVLDEVTENKKLRAYQSVQGLSNFLWRHDMNDLTKRMGQLRDAPQGIGAWARVYGSEQQLGSAIKTRNDSVQIGLDADAGYGWKVGTALTYTNGESAFVNGSADAKSWGLGLYGSWLAQDGRFVDLIAKYSRINNDFALGNMSGDVTNHALSVSAEAGWNIRMASGLFIEPQVEMTIGRVAGERIATSNGVTIDQDDFDAIIARAGIRGGWLLPRDLGNVYVRTSVLHDFKGEARSVATKNLGRVEFKDELGGTWFEMGLGANVNLNNRTYAYVDLERTDSGKVKEKWRWNIGVRHTF